MQSETALTLSKLTSRKEAKRIARIVTAQQPDILISEYPRIDFRFLQLYYLRRGDAHGRHDNLTLPVAPNFPEDHPLCSSLWRGYVATFQLAHDGTLTLVAYSFPFSRSGKTTQAVTNGAISGDFWMVLRPFFFGPNTSVPFRNSRIVEDRSEWSIEDQTLHGRVVKTFNNQRLIVDVDWIGGCFMPRSLLPPELRNELDALVGSELGCEIFTINRDRNRRPME